MYTFFFIKPNLYFFQIIPAFLKLKPQPVYSAVCHHFFFKLVNLNVAFFDFPITGLG